MTTRKIPLAAQIAEIQYQLARVGSVKDMRPAEVELHRSQLQGVLDTLWWLQANRAPVVAAIKGAPL